MAAPTLSEYTPANGATLADIADVSVKVEPNPIDNSDPVKLSTRQISRDGINYPTNYIALPGYSYIIYANIGLFPGDASGTVGIHIESEAGSVSTDTWSFSCREAESAPVSLADITSPAPAALQMRADLLRAYNYEVHQIAGFYSRLALAAPEAVAEFRAIEFSGSFDFAVAQISATRLIEQLLALVSAGVGKGLEETALRSTRVVDGYSYALVLDSLRLRGYKWDYAPVSQALGVEAIAAALTSLGVGREEVTAVLLSLEQTGGEALTVIVDLIDSILGDLR